MDVQEIVNRVLELGMDETDSENTLNLRVLNDVNATYQDLLQSSTDSDDNQLTADVLILLNGAQTLTQRPLLFHSVRDLLNNGKELKRVDIKWLEDRFPLLDDIGDPSYYYLSNYDQLNCYPANGTQVRARYYPAPAVLTLDSVEADIKIPVEFHEAIVAGAVYYTKLREQGFHNEQDRSEAAKFYEMWKNRYLTAMEAVTKADRHVQYYDF